MGVSEKWSLRYVVGPRSMQINTVMRSVLSFCSPRETRCPTNSSSVGGPGRELSAERAGSLHEPCLS